MITQRLKKGVNFQYPKSVELDEVEKQAYVIDKELKQFIHYILKHGYSHMDTWI